MECWEARKRTEWPRRPRNDKCIEYSFLLNVLVRQWLQWYDEPEQILLLRISGKPGLVLTYCKALLDFCNQTAIYVSKYVYVYLRERWYAEPVLRLMYRNSVGKTEKKYLFESMILPLLLYIELSIMYKLENTQERYSFFRKRWNKRVYLI